MLKRTENEMFCSERKDGIYYFLKNIIENYYDDSSPSQSAQ